MISEENNVLKNMGFKSYSYICWFYVNHNYVTVYIKTVWNHLNYIAWILAHYLFLFLNVAIGSDIDFNSTSQSIIITGGSNNITVNVPVTNDSIVEGDETFIMNLTVPSSFGSGVRTGDITRPIVTIIDTSRKLHNYKLFALL